MYQVLATKLYLSASGTASEVSTAVSMEGANSVQVDYTIFSLTGSSPEVSLQLQHSNDLENWTNLGSPSPTTSVGWKLGPSATAVTAAYVRVKYLFSAGSGQTAVIAAGINTTMT